MKTTRWNEWNHTKWIYHQPQHLIALGCWLRHWSSSRLWLPSLVLCCRTNPCGNSRRRRRKWWQWFHNYIKQCGQQYPSTHLQQQQQLKSIIPNFPSTITIQFPTTLTPSRRTYPNDYYSSTPISIASISPIIVNEPLSVACRFVAMTDLTDIDCFIIRSGLYHSDRIGIIDATDVFGFELDGTLPTEMELSTQLTYFTLDENQRKSLVWYWRIIFWSERFHPHWYCWRNWRIWILKEMIWLDRIWSLVFHHHWDDWRNSQTWICGSINWSEQFQRKWDYWRIFLPYICMGIFSQARFHRRYVLYLELIFIFIVAVLVAHVV